MIFRTNEHYDIYDDYIELYDNSNLECLICYETTDDNNEYPIIINNNQQIFKKNCLCNLTTHIICLNTWLTLKNSCPICRKSIIEKKNNISLSLINSDAIFWFYNNKFIILRFLFFMYTIYYLFLTFFLLKKNIN
jgi:uncharacterized CHY-type Zn-finger protein